MDLKCGERQRLLPWRELDGKKTDRKPHGRGKECNVRVPWEGVGGGRKLTGD